MNKLSIIKFVVDILICSILIGCQPSEDRLSAEATEIASEIFATQTAVAQTARVQSTSQSTQIVSSSLIPTSPLTSPISPTPIATSSPTITLTPIAISTPTITPTPIPREGLLGEMTFQIGQQRCVNLGVPIGAANRVWFRQAKPNLSPGITYEFYSSLFFDNLPPGIQIENIANVLEDFSQVSPCFKVEPDIRPADYYMRYFAEISFEGEYLTEGTGYFLIRVLPPVGRDPASRRIAFIVIEANNGLGTPLTDKLLVMNADSSGFSQIIEGSVEDIDVSPDGTQILYSLLTGGNQELHIINADGTDSHFLYLNGAGPKWSPNGEFIAFRNGRDGQLYIVAPDGSGVKKLSNNLSYFDNITWSPDSAQIAINGITSGSDFLSQGIFVINIDGTRFERVTEGDADDPDWSPNGNQIVFVLQRTPRSKGIHVINSDGTGLRDLTPNFDRPSKPAWSPDGERIVFEIYRSGRSKIWMMNADGSGQKEIWGSDAIGRSNIWVRDATDPVWSPDGSQIAFLWQRDTNIFPHQQNQIYVVNIDGTGLINLTADEYATYKAGFVWLP